MTDAWDDDEQPSPIQNKQAVDKQKTWAGEDAEATKPETKEVVKSEEAKKREKQQQEAQREKAENARSRLNAVFEKHGRKSTKTTVYKHSEMQEMEKRRKALLARRLIAHNCKTEEQLKRRMQTVPKQQMDSEWDKFLETEKSKP